MHAPRQAAAEAAPALSRIEEFHFVAPLDLAVKPVEGRDDDPWDVEATVEPLAPGEPAQRPANIVNVDEVELDSEGNQTYAYFTPPEKTRLAGLGWGIVTHSFFVTSEQRFAA